MLFAALSKADFDLNLWPGTLTRPLTLTLNQGNSDNKTQFLAFDLDLWPTNSTYSTNLTQVKVDPYIYVQRLNTRVESGLGCTLADYNLYISQYRKYIGRWT